MTPIEPQAKNKFSADIETIEEQLNVLTQQTRKRIPENLFQFVFLQLFATGHSNHVDGTIENWIKIADTPYHEVDVFDTNNNVIFTVPALLLNDAVDPLFNNRLGSCGDIVVTFNQLAQRSGIEGQNYIDAKLAQISDTVVSKEGRIAYVKQWNQIFERYGIEKMLDLGEATATGTTEEAAQKRNNLPTGGEGDDEDFTNL